MDKNIYAEFIAKAELNEVHKVLIASAIPYAIIKGEPLSFLAYGDFALRKKSDIDILIDKNNIKRFESQLENHGFITQSNSRKDRILYLSSSHQTSPWIKTVNNLNLKVVVDINFDILWGEYNGKRIDIHEFISDAIDMEIYGFKIKTLTVLKSLIQLILHQYKDLNSIFLLATRNSIKYDMFKDLYYLLKNNVHIIKVSDLYNISSCYQIVPYIYYMLYYTRLLFHDRVLDDYIEAFKTQEGIDLLNCYGLNDSERREWKYNFSTRLNSKNVYELIKNDLTEKDLMKININRRAFLNE